MGQHHTYGLVGILAALSTVPSAFAQLHPWEKPFLPVLEEAPVIKDLIQRSKGGVERRSSLGNILPLLPPIRNQQDRGTCSSFASLAPVEVWLQRQGMTQEEADLSEEFQYFLAKTQVYPNGIAGSTDLANIGVLKHLGFMREADRPYDGTDWHTVKSNEEVAKVMQECSTFNGQKLSIFNVQVCQEAHGFLPKLDVLTLASLLSSPMIKRFLPAAKMRDELKERGISLSKLGSRLLLTEEEIKHSIDLGIPMYLAVTYFYGAWNSPRMEEFGIGKWDWKKYRQGNITYPTEKDIAISKQKKSGGHAVVIVGYDDFREKFIIRNSWGTEAMGSEYIGIVDGTSVPMPGYAEIDYSYVFDFGLVSALTPLPN